VIEFSEVITILSWSIYEQKFRIRDKWENEQSHQHT